MKNKKLLVVLGLVLVVLGLVFVGGCDLGSTGRGIDRLYDGKFSFSKEPKLNQVTNLTFNLIASSRMPNTTIDIILPDGIELMLGNTHWEGDLAKWGDTVKHSVEIKIIREGNYTIEAYVKSTFGSDKTRVYLFVSKNKTILSETSEIKHEAQSLSEANKETQTQIEKID